MKLAAVVGELAVDVWHSLGLVLVYRDAISAARYGAVSLSHKTEY